jgi:biotin synthase-related radical SAM superfamily protein
LRPKRSLSPWGPCSWPIPAQADRHPRPVLVPGASPSFFSSGCTQSDSVAQSSPLLLVGREEGVAILMDGREIARGRLIEPLLHCPEQAYITVSERCIFDCKFCAVPKLRGGIKSKQTVLQMVEEAARTGHLRAISLTSGVEVSPLAEAEKVAGIVRDLKSFRVPVGVSISPFPGVNQILKDAGADEVKYNLECVDPELFLQVCPGISYQEIMDALQEAVAVFGKNRVFTNIIVGLGESDELLRRSIDELTERGIIPVLRAVFPHPLRAGEVPMQRPSAERLLDLARYLKGALEKNGLDGCAALTGCYRCTGCDLIPGRDL